MFKKIILALFVASFGLTIASAQERVTYSSQPDEVTIFLNGVAYVRDNLTVVNTADVWIALPSNIYEDTLIVREQGIEVAQYSITTSPTGVRTLQLSGTDAGGVRDLTLEYLASGMTWQPYYRMTLTPDNDTQAQLSYYASIRNDSFTLDNALVRLAAGSVDAYQNIALDDAISMSQNQAFTDSYAVSVNQLATGNVTIQYTYDIGSLTTVAGDTLYKKILDKAFATRRILLWNANSNTDISVIYKLMNDADLPLTDGIVRTYQDGLFTGSDMIEFTPIGSEGSITVGTAQATRVKRTESVQAIDTPLFSNLSNIHDITLTVTNFGTTDITVEVVDIYPTDAQDFTYSQDATAEGDNVLRWVITIKAGETSTLTYQFKSPY